MSYKPMPSLEQLFELFYVDSTSPTGLRNAKTRRGGAQENNPAGCQQDNGYCVVSVNGVLYGAHRVIHKMRTGEDLLDMQVDHKDRNNRNNHPFNLRWADRPLQARNKDYVSSTGFRGVYFCEGRAKPFRAMAKIKGKMVNFGYYATAEEAHAVYKQHQGGNHDRTKENRSLDRSRGRQGR